MKMTGHLTEAVYRRYAIVDEAMLQEGAAKLAALHQAEAHIKPKVIALPKVEARLRRWRVRSLMLRIVASGKVGSWSMSQGGLHAS
jgi:hypothetical protein